MFHLSMSSGREGLFILGKGMIKALRQSKRKVLESSEKLMIYDIAARM